MTGIKINGTDLIQMPEKHHWVTPSSKGQGGTNRPVYDTDYMYEMMWGMMSAAAFEQIWDTWQSTQTTGSVVVELPQLGAGTYQYVPFSGASLDQPEHSGYFEEYYEDVRVIVRNLPNVVP